MVRSQRLIPPIILWSCKIFKILWHNEYVKYLLKCSYLQGHPADIFCYSFGYLIWNWTVAVLDQMDSQSNSDMLAPLGCPDNLTLANSHPHLICMLALDTTLYCSSLRTFEGKWQLRPVIQKYLNFHLNSSSRVEIIGPETECDKTSHTKRDFWFTPVTPLFKQKYNIWSTLQYIWLVYNTKHCRIIIISKFISRK